MTRDLTLAIGEVTVELEAEEADAVAFQQALEAALQALAARLQAAGADQPEPLVVPRIEIADAAVAELLAARDFRRLTDRIAAEIEARLRSGP